jgi:diaminopimelate epimerase
MIVLNADGSRPEMCGNGLRCLALLIADGRGVDRGRYVIETDAGSRVARVERRSGGAEVTLGMGAGRLSGTTKWPFHGRTLEFFGVDMGNPHAVSFVDGLTEPELDVLGPELCAALPGGANVEVVSSRAAGGFSVLVWERGVGRTLACGTGAAAVAVAAVTSGRASYGQPIPVSLPGGLLELTVGEGSLDVTLKGPARRVFSGQVDA